ncbi:MAG: hypothetical protein KC503_33075, partial [Myxococcales bacterium]|nr:hypothetical protein [Myxococcales bacterium]
MIDIATPRTWSPSMRLLNVAIAAVMVCGCSDGDFSDVSADTGVVSQRDMSDAAPQQDVLASDSTSADGAPPATDAAPAKPGSFSEVP